MAITNHERVGTATDLIAPLFTWDFGAFHAAVHDGKKPFAWQQRLLE